MTQSQWRTVSLLDDVGKELKPKPSHFNGKKRPVECVSWDDAIEFCKRLSKHTGQDYRLPSEAEWEYACRANSITPFYCGSTITTALANYRGIDWITGSESASYGTQIKSEYREQTTDVGSFPANAFGLYDMHGNVFEWCLDHWHDSYKNAPTNGSAWMTDNQELAHVRRGGSWNHSLKLCRSAYRNDFSPEKHHLSIGFRVVCAK